MSPGETADPSSSKPAVQAREHGSPCASRAEHDHQGSTPWFACPILKVGQSPLAGSQERQPEPQKRGHAGDHDERTPRVVVQHPRASGVEQAPGDERHHDPGDDSFSTRRRCGSGHIRKDTPASRRVTSGPEKTALKKQRPPERSRSQGGGEAEPFPGAIGRRLRGISGTNSKRQLASVPLPDFERGV